MRLEAQKYLHDIQLAAGRVLRFTRGKTFTDYSGDDLLRSAVERQFEIIGEALAQLHKLDAQLTAKIPDYGRIIAFRNILIHAYAMVDDRIVWGVLERHLPPLHEAVKQLQLES